MGILIIFILVTGAKVLSKLYSGRLLHSTVTRWALNRCSSVNGSYLIFNTHLHFTTFFSFQCFTVSQTLCFFIDSILIFITSKYLFWSFFIHCYHRSILAVNLSNPGLLSSSFVLFFSHICVFLTRLLSFPSFFSASLHEVVSLLLVYHLQYFHFFLHLLVSGYFPPVSSLYGSFCPFSIDLPSLFSPINTKLLILSPFRSFLSRGRSTSFLSSSNLMLHCICLHTPYKCYFII